MTATLLLHGLGGCSYDWSGAAALLPGRVVVPDAPYHGGRAGECALDFRAFAEDALRQLDQLGVETAVVAGISMGAATALTMTALAPDRVAGLLLVAPAWLDTPFPVNLKRLRKLGRMIDERGLGYAWQVMSALPPADRWRPEHHDELAARFHAFDATAVAKALRELPGELPVLDHDALAALRGRCAVAGWLDDPIHPVELAERTAALLGAAPPRIFRRPADRDEEQRLLADQVRAVTTLARRSAHPSPGHRPPSRRFAPPYPADTH
ncbi:alpha/beta fold hydrolase [Amycolatopsis nigrescens]|uniref:alpha/beta fold hydrolase n=1 Tax=Amycolatopsis nigrescens TaxID=381445 RepID=UPI0003651F3B|nr:alpha/beta fold hydrolase [Amycolatopsis nigrescens]